MTSEARTPGVSPEWEKARQLVLDYECQEWGQIQPEAAGECLISIIAAGLREAQVEALESVAKEECELCQRGRPLRLIDGDWFHGDVREKEDGERLWGWCEASYAVHEALARLRQSASAPDER